MTEIRSEDLVQCDAADRPALESFMKAHDISLTVDEFSRVCGLLGRRPTLVELHIFNTMWSEHCSYKSSRSVLGKYLPTEAPHVVLGPGEDAGIIRFADVGGRSWCVVMAHESHNHPSQVLPVEGAATGIGGIVRDVYCMGADVIGVMDPLRFGDPDGPNAARVRDIAWGVVDGIAQYGNALGVPNYGGDTYFDASYDDNCLVNVVAIGIVEEGRIVRSRVPDEARNRSYSMILIGKPTDASGFGGATFASERLSEEEAVERQGAVQVPDPFLKRVLAEAIREMLAWADENGVPIGFKDLGAGGIACASSEMAEAGGLGVSIDLDRVNCAFADMPSEVVSCSETQERFMLAVPTEFEDQILKIFNEYFELPNLYTGAGAFVIGEVTADKRFKIARGGRLVSDADVEAITTGIRYDREAKEDRRLPPSMGLTRSGGVEGTREAFVKLLSSYNISTKDIVYKHYDSEVQGRAVIRPGEADASVAVLVPGEPVGLAAGIGGSSRLAKVDPYLGGVWSVLEAVRNVVCVGATPLAITDCLNFGDPEDPGVFYQFSEAVRGIGDACRALRIGPGEKHGVPVVSGNVSFYNQSETGDAIAPTPIVSCVGRIDNAATAENMSFKHPGSAVWLLGELHDRMAGSEFDRFYGDGTADAAPKPDFDGEVAILRSLLDGFRDGTIAAAHDISHGGLLVTVAEMVVAGAPYDVGCELDLTGIAEPRCFGEYGGVVVEVPADQVTRFEATLEQHGAPGRRIGVTSDAGGLRTATDGGTLAFTADELRAAFAGGVADLLN
jgi:phosphoribosylformylglycinamidine synthase